LVSDFGGLFRSEGLKAEVFHILDEPLLESIRRAGRGDESHESRVMAHRDAARSLGAAVFFATCSTLSPLVARLPHTPDCATLRIDQPMIDEARSRSGPLAVIATNPTAIRPCLDMLGKDAESHVLPEAFAAYTTGDYDRHDELVLRAIASSRAPTVVLAQASMARVRGRLSGSDRARVLTSPHSAIAALATLLGESPNL